MYPRWITKPSDGANLREVGPRLYVGGASAPFNPPAGQKWALVVDLIGQSLPSRIPIVGGTAKYPAHVVLALPIEDGCPIPDEVIGQALVAFGENRNRGNTLVHCAAGLSRSASTAYAALRFFDDLDHAAALKRVQTPGVTAWPHPETLGSARSWVQRATTQGLRRPLAPSRRRR